MKEPTKQELEYTDSLTKYLIVYLAILILSGLQFVLAYQHADVTSMIFRMFAVAILEAGLAVMYFMQLGSENRIFITWIAIVALLVLGTLQYGLTDSNRMQRDSPKAFRAGPSQ